ncbi:hypothetical protein PYW07_012499 [Mythimna separata]|uniref:THAP-type domain-containing protein n=1 Tax=Mythimna separata TaxID=271217 RepID=A0AAD7YLB1_MYTSE|nr:hypothetical protein PYW07_012499 [Mythimna separata]
MPVCAVRLCRNYVGKPYNNTKITFHRFPTDPILANRWRDIILRTRSEDQWTPHKTSVVCSEHFCDDDLYFTKKGLRRIKNGSVPSKCLVLSASETESSNNIKQDPPASNMDLQNKSIEPQPSCSKEPVSDDDERRSVLQDFSDLESIFDSPREAKLRRTLRRKIVLERKYKAIINSLRKKNIRLRKQNISFKCIIKTLKKQRLINEPPTS